MLYVALLLGAFLGMVVMALCCVAHEADRCIACLHRTQGEGVECESRT